MPLFPFDKEKLYQLVYKKNYMIFLYEINHFTNLFSTVIDGLMRMKPKIISIMRICSSIKGYTRRVLTWSFQGRSSTSMAFTTVHVKLEYEQVCRVQLSIKSDYILFI